LHAAAAAGANEVTTYLLDQGVVVDVKGSCNKTALHWAIQNNKEQTVALLLQRGACPTTFSWADDEDGMNPLMYAVKYAGGGIVTLLLGADASIKATNARNQNAFDIAHSLRKTRICALFGNSKEMRDSIQRAIEAMQQKS
jgi:ankyrin repeat protein